MDGTVAEPVPRAVKTTCPYCGVGCGVLARPDGRGRAAIAGDPSHPANFGRLCSKGSALGETLGLEMRLLHPMLDGSPVPWDLALDHVARRLDEIRSAHGPGSIAFYLSGQLLTEDYYVANKLAKGFIGTPHVDTNSRLCMASSVAGHRRAFGADVVPQCYDDLELADLVVLVGSNAAWCHPVLYQRIQAARGERGMRVVNIDPRHTATSEGCDLHLAIAPGSDSILFNGLLVWLADRGLLDRNFLELHTTGFNDTLAAARLTSPTTARAAESCGLGLADVELFYSWFSSTRRAVTCYSQGVNQSAQGTDKVNAIINCHLATGMIGKPGSGPLSFTGQPNAMGGREVGGLANMLAAHMGFSEIERERVARFWSAPNLVSGEGLKAVAMFDAIARGEIKALWVMGTNPAVSMPRADAVRAALAKLELFVVSENVASNDTLNRNAVRLPAAAWGEKDGTVTNSERRISRQRGFLTLPGDAKPDWWIMGEVAKRLGFGNAFAYTSPAEIFDEHARLSGFENVAGAQTPERAFDISGCAGLAPVAYDSLDPVQWPYRANQVPTERMFGSGGFFTTDRRARLIPVSEPRLASPVSDAWPFILNTGRVRDQWHTMTRTGLSARLSTHIAEPFVEIHPEDASRMGLEQGTIATVETEHGVARLRVLLNRGQSRGSLFTPIHWSAENSAAARVSALVHGVVDPISGQPEAKATPARIEAIAASTYGLIVSRAAIRPANAIFWAASPTMLGADPGHLLYFAFNLPCRDVIGWQRATLPAGEWVTLEDALAGTFRTAVFKDGRLDAVMYAASSPKLPTTDWLRSQFSAAQQSGTARRGLLAGQPTAGGTDEGPIVCVCYQVGSLKIEAAARDGCTTTKAIGVKLGAGTNCGSCLPEISRLLAGKSARPAVAT